MFGNRIQVNLTDRSSFVLESSPFVGAMVLQASKGTTTPVLVAPGQEEKLNQLLGYPSATYPHVWDAIEFNKRYPLWVSAPAGTGALHGGVLVTVDGTRPLTKGVADLTAFDIEAVAEKETVGTGDGTTVAFAYTVDYPDEYNNQSIDILVDGVSLAVTATDAEPEVLSGTGISAGTYTRATGALSLTFSVAPALGAVIEVVYTTDQSANAYFALFEKAQHAGNTAFTVDYDTTKDWFEITYEIQNNRGTYVEIDTYTAGLASPTFNDVGQNIYLEEVFEENEFITVKVFDLAYSAFVDDTARVLAGGGYRGTTPSESDVVTGWTQFRKVNTYPFNVALDPTGLDLVVAELVTLRDSYSKYADYITVIPGGITASGALTTKTGYNLNNRGVAVYWNRRYVREKYNRTKILVSQVGNIGVKWGEITENAFRGLAPAFIDESGLGGQLTGDIISLEYDPSELEIQSLSDAGINAINFTPAFGVMILDHKTGQSATVLTDTTYIAHSRLFDYIIDNVIQQVLIFQITKLNDPIHRQTATTKTQAIINPLLARGLLREVAIVCNETNNTDEVLSKRQFKLAVVVKVTPTSEKVILDFINVGQTTDVNLVVGG